METKVFFQIEIIINSFVIPAAFEYLFYGSTVNRHILTLTVRGLTVVEFLTYNYGPRARGLMQL